MRSRSESRDSRSASRDRRSISRDRRRKRSRSASRDSRSASRGHRYRSRSASREQRTGPATSGSSDRILASKERQHEEPTDYRETQTNLSDTNEIKAAVTESNGEISCSVEETNRIRALLGLKPLTTDKPSKLQQAVDNFKEQQKKLEQAELKERIEKAKNKRLLKEKLDGKTLGEADEEGLSSAAAWVMRSRRKELTEKEKAKQAAELAAKRLQEEEEANVSQVMYASADLKGLSVMHGTDDFSTGEEVVLTLADSSILNTDEDGKVLGVNEEGDVLENVNLAEKERRAEREKQIKRARQPVYAGYDDAEFEEGVVPGTRPSILPQYDKEKKAGPKMMLGETGEGMTTDEGAMDISSSDKPIPQSLKVDTKEMAEYLTTAEFASFAKPKKDRKKKRKIRKKEESTSSSLIEELEAQLEEEDSGNGERLHRGRRDGASGREKIMEEEGKRRAAYDAAVRAAEEKSRAANATGVGEIDIEEDDADISESLARARRIALLKNKEKQRSEAQTDDAASVVVAERTRRLAEKDKSKDAGQRTNYGDTVEMTGIAGLDDADALDAEGRKKDGTLVFTSTTEFTTRLQARLHEKARSRAEAALKDMDVEEGSEDDEEDQKVTSKWVDVERDSGMEMEGGWSESKGETRNQEESDEEKDDQLEFLHKQPVLKGMAATLQMLKGTGDLNRKEELAGRAKDTRDIDPSSKDFGVKLEYRDEKGRKLTQKEAFRQISYRFHGFGPGTKKKEKRNREYENQAKSSSSRGGVSADQGTMLSLTRAQEATGKAHITVQGGISSATSAAQLAASIAQKKSKSNVKGSSKHK
eukprot:CAMPEP_0185027142 /NCGR_PEP_ID=MMETSP1103-20130426/11931_1 /TAXON_ID=36769 /ORGANISM="Paraphysomonas bandaiensis, Strain Caron Lab Isolate" /LENGTH=816 /DNA_ID=CAMNT_0027561011 /DNA_START=222 /DNA_END=2672 /DNA_ORIENTATION=+